MEVGCAEEIYGTFAKLPNGRASKDQVQRTIQRELSLDELPEPPDVADALAAALCHYYEQKRLAP